MTSYCVYSIMHVTSPISHDLLLYYSSFAFYFVIIADETTPSRTSAFTVAFTV